MEKTLGYIFGSLQVSEAAIGGIMKDLKIQSRINKLVAVALIFNTLSVYCSAEHCLENKKKIKELEKKIERMEKELKGE